MEFYTARNEDMLNKFPTDFKASVGQFPKIKKKVMNFKICFLIDI